MKNILILGLLALSVAASRARRMLREAQWMHACAIFERHHLMADFGLLFGVGDSAELQAIATPDGSDLAPVSKP